MAAKTYDVKCYELAEHFLQDHPDYPEVDPKDRCKQLASDIQDAIEVFFEIEEWKSKEAKHD